jgi:uncharacterized protein YecE (DUF72 family)
MTETATDESLDETAPLVRIGCAGLPNGVSRTQYFKQLDLLETDVAFIEPPRELALRRWHADAPPGAAFTMIGWQLITHDADTDGYARLHEPLPAEKRREVGSFRVTPTTRDAWARTVAAARVLESEVILLQTPPSFSPSQANQDAMRRFFAEVVGDERGPVIAWEPRGVWAPQTAGKLAAELGVVLAVDPLQLEIEPPEGAEAYFRLYGLGLQRGRIDEHAMDLIADMLDGYQRAWVVFNNVEKYPDAQRFRKLMAGREFVEHDDDADTDDDE